MNRAIFAMLIVFVLALVFASPADARRHVRHADGRPSAWCGWWMMHHRGLSDRGLWLARNWAKVGRAVSGPAERVIGVTRRHVFEVIRVVGPGRVLAISGNDGHAVRTRVRSTAGVFAWRVL